MERSLRSLDCARDDIRALGMTREGYQDDIARLSSRPKWRDLEISRQARNDNTALGMTREGYRDDIRTPDGITALSFRPEWRNPFIAHMALSLNALCSLNQSASLFWISTTFSVASPVRSPAQHPKTSQSTPAYDNCTSA